MHDINCACARSTRTPRTWVRAIIVDSQWVKLIFIYICIVYFLLIMILSALTKIVCVTACAFLVETVSSYLE